MFKNYCKLVFRNLLRNKTYGALNIAGLAIGITCAGLIFLWVEDELAYNSSFDKKEQLHWVRVRNNYEGAIRVMDATPAQLAGAIKNEVPGIVNSCRKSNGRFLFALGEKKIYETGFYVDSTFFNMFGFGFVQGNPATAFQNLYSVVITENMAQRFFGNDKQVVGKTLRVDNNQDYIVTGVIKNPPLNASLQFDWLSPFQIFVNRKPWVMREWGANTVGTYVELEKNASVAKIDKQLYGFLGEKNKFNNDPSRPFLFAMKDWRLRDNFENGVQTGGRIVFVKLFAIIACVILLVACINFMNLATARSAKRASEVGVRKALGAVKGNLVGQFIGEALLMSALAVILGVVLIVLVLPFFNMLVEKQAGVALAQPLHLAVLVGVTVVCGLVAGSYPAFYLSSFNPVYVFKGMKVKDSSAINIRKGLVVFQFTVSIVLIISAAIVYQQVQYIKNRDLGYNKNNLVSMNITGNMEPHFEEMRQHLLNTGVIEEVALCSNDPLRTGNNTTGYKWEGKNEAKDILVSIRTITPGYFNVMGLQLQSGRGFYDNMAADSGRVIITAALEKLMGKGSAVGKTIYREEYAYTVAGVVKDYVYGDMYGSPDPVVFYNDHHDTRYMYVRYKAGVQAEAALAAIKVVMKADNPDYPFDYSFVDELFDQRFKSETLVGKLARLFAVLSVFISCLGLFGLAAYTAEQRTREMGIRKVLGATMANITALLCADFLRLITVAALVAFPVAWWFMQGWLQSYAYRIHISIWIFVVAGLSALFIALLTISFQSVKAAMTNPVKSLRGGE